MHDSGCRYSRYRAVRMVIVTGMEMASSDQTPQTGDQLVAQDMDSIVMLDAEKDVCSKRYPARDEMMQVGSKHAVFRRRMQGLQDGIGGLLSGAIARCSPKIEGGGKVKLVGQCY